MGLGIGGLDSPRFSAPGLAEFRSEYAFAARFRSEERYRIAAQIFVNPRSFSKGGTAECVENDKV